MLIKIKILFNLFMYSTVFKTEQILVGSQNEQNIRTACFCLGRSEDAARGWS